LPLNVSKTIFLLRILQVHVSDKYGSFIKVFTPTDAQVFFNMIIKIYIKTAPTCFGVITIIRERTIWAC